MESHNLPKLLLNSFWENMGKGGEEPTGDGNKEAGLFLWEGRES